MSVDPLSLKRVECACGECQRYCTHIPGWFLPHEVDGAAAALGLTPQEFFDQHLVVDWWVGNPLIFVLRPRATREKGGAESVADPRLGGGCAFFKSGKCTIHATKPHECATVSHDHPSPAGWHKATAEAWLPHQARVIELLGREPVEEEMDVFSMFGGF